MDEQVESGKPPDARLSQPQLRDSCSQRPASAVAATPSTPYDVLTFDSPVSQPFARFPERLADAGDLTGDGVRDVFASSYKLDHSGDVDAGAVFLLSGADRSLVYELTATEPQAGAQFGFYISVPGDVSGDGKDDVVVGAPFEDVYTGSGPQCGEPEPNGCNENQRRVYVFSGPTGRLLYRLENPHPQSDEGVFGTFGARIGSAGELTGDRRADFIVGSPASDVPSGCGNLSPIPAVGWPGALQPPAPTDPGVTVSRHRALPISRRTCGPCASARRGRAVVRAARSTTRGSASRSAAVCISSQPSASGRR